MNKEQFIDEVKKLGLNIDDDKLNKLDTYKNLLLEYNKKFNLTAITEDEEIYLKHFYDSLTLVKAIDLNQNLKGLDIGTGAGFPGIVLKIFFPNLDLILLDSNGKKITFLNEVINKLNLKKIKCLNIRAEQLSNEYREYFDFITSRAVARLRILIELALPYLKVDGKFIAMKGNVKEELEESQKILTLLNGELLANIEFTLPIKADNRSLIIITKKAKTTLKYPRKYEQILKNK